MRDPSRDCTRQTHLLQTAISTARMFEVVRLGGAAAPGNIEAATASACRRAPCSSLQNRHADRDVNPDAGASRNYTVVADRRVPSMTTRSRSERRWRVGTYPKDHGGSRTDR